MELNQDAYFARKRGNVCIAVGLGPIEHHELMWPSKKKKSKGQAIKLVSLDSDSDSSVGRELVGQRNQVVRPPKFLFLGCLRQAIFGSQNKEIF